MKLLAVFWLFAQALFFRYVFVQTIFSLRGGFHPREFTGVQGISTIKQIKFSLFLPPVSRMTPQDQLMRVQYPQRYLWFFFEVTVVL